MTRATGTVPPSSETFAIGEAAAMLGMTAHTIRAWERRFAAVSPMRTHSGQRRYRLEDVETLKRVKDLASSRGLSLRIAVAEALGELPELEGLGPQSSTAGEEATRADGGPWRVVADLDPRLLLILDAGGKVFDANVAFARFTGVLRFELPGSKFSELVDPYDRAKAVAIYRGKPQQRTGWELNLRTPVGSGLFAFDCYPFRNLGSWLIACAGREVA